jgi:hypothetical protein
MPIRLVHRCESRSKAVRRPPQAHNLSCRIGIWRPWAIHFSSEGCLLATNPLSVVSVAGSSSDLVNVEPQVCFKCSRFFPRQAKVAHHCGQLTRQLLTPAMQSAQPLLFCSMPPTAMYYKGRSHPHRSRTFPPSLQLFSSPGESSLEPASITPRFLAPPIRPASSAQPIAPKRHWP